MKQSFLPICIVLLSLMVMATANAEDAGSMPASVSSYKILEPISHGDLTIFL